MSSTTTSDSITTISVKLGESNYQSWVVKMRALLMSKKLWMYVKGDIPRPSASGSTLSDWLSNAHMLLLVSSSSVLRIVNILMLLIWRMTLS